MRDEDQRRLLGAFVRVHRERARPDAAAGRRRTPGLRREELAARAGISATWCAWIEQGRDVRASPQALARLAAALDLSRAERAYLFDLAGRRDPDAGPLPAGLDAPASLRAVTHALRVPSYGLDRRWDACCWNAAAERLFGGWLGAGCQRNLLRFVFLDPAARRLLPDWRSRALRLLAEFRADTSRSLDDPHTRAMVEELRHDSRDFATGWEAQEVQDRQGGLRTFNHPEDGVLTFRQHTFGPADRPDFKLVVLDPVVPGDGV